MLEAMASATVGAVPSAMAMHIPFALGLARCLSLLFDPIRSTLEHSRSSPKSPKALACRPSRSARRRFSDNDDRLSREPADSCDLSCRRVRAHIELRRHQRFTAPYFFAASVLMTLVCVLAGVFPL